MSSIKMGILKRKARFFTAFVITFTLIAFLIIMLPLGSAFGSASLNVSAANNHIEKLTVQCREYDTALVGMKFNIFKIAEISGDNSYVTTPEFSAYKVNINNMTGSESIAAAETLETYAYVDGIKPTVSGVVDASGIVEFEKLAYGVYMLSGEPMTIGSKFFMPAPSIIVLDESLDMEDGVQYNYNVVTVPKVKVLAASDRIYNFNAVVKLFWENDDPKTRPKSVSVTLTKDGQVFRTVELSDENNWTMTWKNLSTKYKWNVTEDAVPTGYTMTTVKNDININPKDPNEHDVEFIITNKGSYVPPTEAVITTVSEKLPQTGQLWWPVPVMSASGMVVFAAGWKVNSHKRKKDEK